MAVRAKQPQTQVPSFPLSTAELRRLLDQYDPTGSTKLEPDKPQDVHDDPEDIITWIESFCTIVSDEGKGLIPFKLFDYQKDVIRAFQAHRETIILKARQLGMSELVAAYVLHQLMHHPRWTAIILSKGQEEASEFLGKARIAYDNIPDSAKPPLKNPAITSVLLLSNGSRIIPKPTTTGAGRSYAAQLLVLDEWGHQLHQGATYSAAAPIARSAGNKIIGLSSANGDGNFFATQWHKAREAQQLGEPDFMYPIFLPWSVRPGRDELWYKRATAGMEDWQAAQEFPTTEEEAFILSGNPRFDVDALRAIRQTCREPAHTDLEPKLGGLYVWEAPQPQRRYVIGADVAEGLEKGDFSAAVCLDFASGLEVAALRGRWEPTTFGHKLNELGWMYSTTLPDGSQVPAFMGVERNASGGTVLSTLHHICQYPNLFYHQDYDATVEGKRPGWATTPRSKPLMIDTLATCILERRPYRWLQFVEECLTYVRLEDGKTEASGNSHDDVVMSMAIAEMCRRWMPTQREVISLTEELGIPASGGAPLVGDPYAGFEAAEASGLVSPFGGVIQETRYRLDSRILRLGPLY